MRALIGAGSVLAVGACVGVLGLAELGANAAPAKAKVTVTIKQNNAEMSGTVSSPKPVKCAKNRTVWVWEQIGTRGGGNDIKSFSDTTSLQNGKYVWNTGNTGVEGKFYAKVGAKPGCKPDSSPTINVFRNP